MRNKPLFASLLRRPVTLVVSANEEAMTLFKLPRKLEFMKGEGRGQCGRIGAL